MNYKEDENVLVLNLNLKIFLNLIAYLGIVMFMGHRLYLANRPSSTTATPRIVVPRLKTENLDAIVEFLNSDDVATKSAQILTREPF